MPFVCYLHGGAGNVKQFTVLHILGLQGTDHCNTRVTLALTKLGRQFVIKLN